MFDLTREEVPLQKGIKKAYSVPSLKGLFLETSSPAKILSNRKRRMVFYFREFEASAGAIKACAEGGSAFAIPIYPLLQKTGVQRAVLISRMRNFLRMCRKFGAGFFFCSLAGSEIEARNFRELVGFGELLGLSENEARERMKTLKTIVE